MGELRRCPKVLPIFAAFSSDEALLDQIPDLLSQNFGPLALRSERFAFVETGYYSATMGTNLKKQFFTLAALRPADFLAEAKLRANELEKAVAATAAMDVERPINLDPGYIHPGKLVLASTKDHAHRIYLGQGIFAEATLRFRHDEWEPWPWTFPDYRREDVRQFLKLARRWCRELQERERTGEAQTHEK